MSEDRLSILKISILKNDIREMSEFLRLAQLKKLYRLILKNQGKVLGQYTEGHKIMIVVSTYTTNRVSDVETITLCPRGMYLK